MPTFGSWEDTVLDLAWDVADHISLHTYYDPAKFDSTEAFLGASLDLDRMIDTVAATADAVAGRKGSRKRVSLSVDEWNVWYQTPTEKFERRGEPFVEAPPLIEDTYTVTDALVVGSVLITLLRHADRVRMACLAQLVNVIAPIRTENGGRAWRQASYFPFADVARHGRGTVLRVEPEVATYDDDIPLLEATAVHDGDETLTVFAVNRSAEPLTLEATLHGLGTPEVAEHAVLADDDPAAANTADEPDRVTPRSADGAHVADGVLHASLPPRSWNVLRLVRAA
jgi:alpha-N-arabinofuranosidase